MDLEKAVFELIQTVAKLEAKVDVLWKINFGIIMAVMVNIVAHAMNIIKNGRRKK